MAVAALVRADLFSRLDGLLFLLAELGPRLFGEGNRSERFAVEVHRRIEAVGGKGADDGVAAAPEHDGIAGVGPHPQLGGRTVLQKDGLAIAVAKPSAGGENMIHAGDLLFICAEADQSLQGHPGAAMHERRLDGPGGVVGFEPDPRRRPAQGAHGVDQDVRCLPGETAPVEILQQ